MKILRSSGYHRMPWKNGGGITSEIAAFPEGSGLANFGWRISMALVASNGPFSTFAGIDRTLTILEGDGLWLTFSEQEPQPLNRNSQPLFFPADIPTSATLGSGSVTDLNVMTRRGVYKHRVQRLNCDQPVQLTPSAKVMAIFCAGGMLELLFNEETVRLATKDCVLLDESDANSFLLRGKGEACLIEIFADGTV